MSIKFCLSEAERQGMFYLKGDKIYRYLLNDDTDANTMQYGKSMVFSADNADGVDQPATASLHNFAGIVSNPYDPSDTTYSVAVGQYGWVCVWGTCKALVKGDGTAIAAGQALKLTHSASYLVKDEDAGTKASFPSHCIALEAATGAAVYIDVHVRAKL